MKIAIPRPDDPELAALWDEARRAIELRTPQPMSPAEVRDLVERVRISDAQIKRDALARTATTKRAMPLPSRDAALQVIATGCKTAEAARAHGVSAECVHNQLRVLRRGGGR